MSIRPVRDGLEIEIVGEIAKMVELGTGTDAKKAALNETTARSVKVVAGSRFVQARTELKKLV